MALLPLSLSWIGCNLNQGHIATRQLCLVAGNYAVLFPMGTTPQIVSAFLKHYLATLPEPLLTYK